MTTSRGSRPWVLAGTVGCLTLGLLAPAPATLAIAPAPGGEAWASVVLELPDAPLAGPPGAGLAARDRAIGRQQDTLARRVTALGARVAGRYSAALNGLWVHTPRRRLAALAGLEGVARIHPAPLARLASAWEVHGPPSPARRGEAAPSAGGEGLTIAIVDTGIDYTHAYLGGPGSPMAYQQAVTGAERIDDTWGGVPLFPTAKVVGGYDFVGPNYSSPSACPPASEQAGYCTATPHPDPDPLDQQKHGSHVAGIAAGEAVAGLPDGMAPRARLVALKIFGPPSGPVPVDESVDGVLSAIDWCVRVNLGLAVPGTAPSRVDVISMSLGEPFGQGASLFEAAIARAGEAGIVVVASAGNAGGNSFIHGAPGTAVGAIGVANLQVASGGGAGAVMAGNSSRGPASHGPLKPNLATVGTAILSADMGRGAMGTTMSGTSMAAPRVAGAAALVLERGRLDGLELTPADVMALLMNTARPDVTQAGRPGRRAKVAEQGAGEMDVEAALDAQVIARVHASPTGEAAALNLGFQALDTAERATTFTIGVRNLGPQALRLRAEPEWTLPPSGEAVLAWSLPAPFDLAPGALREVSVTATLVAARLRPWPLRTIALGFGMLDPLELDGWLRFSPVGPDDAPLASPPPARLPFYALARRASGIHGSAPGPDDGGPALRLADGIHPGEAQIFVPGLGPDGRPAGPDPHEPGLAGIVDLRDVGVRLEAGPDPQLAFAIRAEAPRLLPNTVLTEVYLDTDDDGRVDRRVRLGPIAALSGGSSLILPLGWSVAPWDEATGTAGADERVTPVEGSDLGTGLTLLRVPAAAAGVAPERPFRFYIRRQGLGEDFWKLPAEDFLPDGAGAPGGPRLRHDLAAWALVPGRWSAALAAGETLDIPLEPTGSPGTLTGPWLAAYPDNEPSDPRRQLERLELGAVRREIWLPMLVRRW